MHKIAEFADAIGATPSREYRTRNYFNLNDRFLVVKISRIDPPFWGLGKAFIEKLEDYSLVLLIPGHRGWVFSKSEVDAHIRRLAWRLCESDNNYKIHHRHMPKSNAFAGASSFFRKLGADES
jgi:hypothetical protein